MVRYERIDADEAEVAFNIEDAHQGRGLGSVFLEHIAAAARERGISRFVADVLPDQPQDAAGLLATRATSSSQAFDDGVVRAVVRPRADRGLAGRHLRPRAPGRGRVGPAAAAAGVGRGRRRRPRPEQLGRPRRAAAPARRRASPGRSTRSTAGPTRWPGVPSYRLVWPTCRATVDLAVVAVPADEVEAVVADCAAKGVRGAGRDVDRVRRDRRGGRGAAAPAGTRGAGQRHAGARPELVRLSRTPTPRCR